VFTRKGENGTACFSSRSLWATEVSRRFLTIAQLYSPGI
jgi:hypothetical protein